MPNQISTGIAGLDYILHGGIPQGASVAVEGTPGTGKTTLGFQFLVQGIVQHDEPGIYITFEELPEQLYKDMMAFGWDLRQLEKENKLRVLCMSPEVLMEQMMAPGGLFEQVVEQIRCKRAVIDSISLFQYGTDRKDLRRQAIYSLRNILRKFSITALLIKEQTVDASGEVPFENFVVGGGWRQFDHTWWSQKCHHSDRRRHRHPRGGYRLVHHLRLFQSDPGECAAPF